jgi:hypothetical protein
MKYKNISKKTQTLMGFGIVKPEGTIDTKIKINNPNFKLVEEKPAEEGVKTYDRPKSYRKAS